MEKDSGGKLASLPPAKLNFSAKVTQIATGLQHTLLLTIHGEVYAFGSNNYGQLGLLDLNPRGIPTPVDLTPRGIFFILNCKVHLILKQCFARSSVDTIW